MRMYNNWNALSLMSHFTQCW